MQVGPDTSRLLRPCRRQLVLPLTPRSESGRCFHCMPVRRVRMMPASAARSEARGRQTFGFSRSDKSSGSISCRLACSGPVDSLRAHLCAVQYLEQAVYDLALIRPAAAHARLLKMQRRGDLLPRRFPRLTSRTSPYGVDNRSCQPSADTR